MSADMDEWKDKNLGVRKQLKSCTSSSVLNTRTREITNTNQTLQFSYEDDSESKFTVHILSVFLSSELITLDLTILLSHCFSTCSHPNWGIYGIVWLHFLSSVDIIPCSLLSATVSKLYPPHNHYLNLWPLRFCFKAVKRQALGEKFPWYNHNKCRLFS